MNADRSSAAGEQSSRSWAGSGETPRGGLTGVALTDDDRRGRDWWSRWMREAGLAVAVDQMGNIFGQRAGDGQRARR